MVSHCPLRWEDSDSLFVLLFCKEHHFNGVADVKAQLLSSLFSSSEYVFNRKKNNTSDAFFVASFQFYFWDFF